MSASFLAPPAPAPQAAAPKVAPGAAAERGDGPPFGDVLGRAVKAGDAREAGTAAPEVRSDQPAEPATEGRAAEVAAVQSAVARALVTGSDTVEGLPTEALEAPAAVEGDAIASPAPAPAEAPTNAEPIVPVEAETAAATLAAANTATSASTTTAPTTANAAAVEQTADDAQTTPAPVATGTRPADGLRHDVHAPTDAPVQPARAAASSPRLLAADAEAHTSTDVSAQVVDGGQVALAPVDGQVAQAVAVATSGSTASAAVAAAVAATPSLAAPATRAPNVAAQAEAVAPSAATDAAGETSVTVPGLPPATTGALEAGAVQGSAPAAHASVAAPSASVPSAASAPITVAANAPTVHDAPMAPNAPIAARVPVVPEAPIDPIASPAVDQAPDGSGLAASDAPVPMAAVPVEVPAGEASLAVHAAPATTAAAEAAPILDGPELVRGQAVAQRVAQIAKQLENAPPPRSILVELTELPGLRVEVRLAKDGGVHVLALGTADAVAPLGNIGRDLADALGQRGMHLGEFSTRDDADGSPANASGDTDGRPSDDQTRPGDAAATSQRRTVERQRASDGAVRL